jgi:hypothetical protein
LPLRVRGSTALMMAYAIYSSKSTILDQQNALLIAVYWCLLMI